jgi:hypothetical protein
MVQQLKTTNSVQVTCEYIEAQRVMRLSVSEKLKNNVYWFLTPCGLVQVHVSVKSSDAIIKADVISTFSAAGVSKTSTHIYQTSRRRISDQNTFWYKLYLQL